MDKLSKGPRVGFAVIARRQFDVDLARENGRIAAKTLEGMGFRLEVHPEVITTSEEGWKLGQHLAAAGVDLVVLFQGTFADASVASAVVKEWSGPTLIWGWPEDARGGERLRANALCGLNLAAHVLYRKGRPVKVVYSRADDEGALRQIRAFASAAAVLKRLRGMRIVLVGSAPLGYDACEFDEMDVRRYFGIDVERVSLDQVFGSARSLDGMEVSREVERVSADLRGWEAVDRDQVEASVRGYLALRKLAENRNAQALAVECWPAFMTDLGGAACYALGRLTDEGIMAACEADLNGAIGMLIGNALTGKPSAVFDLVSVEGPDLLFLWHCGAGPLSLASGVSPAKATVHPNRKVGLTMHFTLQGGTATIWRLGVRPEGGFRLLCSVGHLIDREAPYWGCNAVVKMDDREGFLSAVLNGGFEHHFVVSYGDIRPQLEAIAELAGLQLVGGSVQAGAE